MTTYARFYIVGLLAVFGCANTVEGGGGETGGSGGDSATTSGVGGASATTSGVGGATGSGAGGGTGGGGVGGDDAACTELYDATAKYYGGCCNFVEGNAIVTAVGAEHLELDFGDKQHTFHWLGQSLDQYFVGGEQVSITIGWGGEDVFLESDVVKLSTHGRSQPYGSLTAYPSYKPELPDGLQGEWLAQCTSQDPDGFWCGLFRHVHAMNVTDPMTGTSVLVQPLQPTNVGGWQITLGRAVTYEHGTSVEGTWCDTGWGYFFTLLKLPPG